MTSKAYSCTNMRYASSPLTLTYIDLMPRGTLLYACALLDIRGQPSAFTLSQHQDCESLTFRLIEDTPYIIGLPKNNPIEDLCYEACTGERMCFDSELKEESAFPQPCAWWDDPYFYVCDLSLIEGPLEDRETPS